MSYAAVAAAGIGVAGSLGGGMMGKKKSKVAKYQKFAAHKSLLMAEEFYQLGAIPQMKGTQEAIDLARSNLGNYKPEVAESRRLTDLGALGITEDQIEKYTNPYLQDVLDFSINDMEEAAARRREQQRAIASRSGNDFATNGTVNRYQIEDSLADRELTRSIGGLSADVRKTGFDEATRLSENERARQADAGKTYADYANQTQQLGNAEVGALAAVGEMEAIPEHNKRKHLIDAQQRYSNVVKDTTPSVEEYRKPDMLSQIIGAAGAGYNLFSGGNKPSGGGGGSMFNFSSSPTPRIAGSGSGLPGFGGFNDMRSGSGATQIPLGDSGGGGLLSSMQSFFGGGTK